MAEEVWQEIGFHHATEAAERKQIRYWMEAEGHWSGNGKHVKDSEIVRAKIHTNDLLGGGSGGYVQKITYGTVSLAQKRIRLGPRRNIELLRREADIMDKLTHQHIVTLVGTYISPKEFVLISYPVAQCNLYNFLSDIDNIQSGHGYDMIDTVKHFENLGFKLKQTTKDGMVVPCLKKPLDFLQSVLGCITDAVTFVHEKRIRHRDIKPENILLCPNQVYLTDFGISRDLKDSPNSITGEQCGSRSYMAPEVVNDDAHHMEPADIFSLGAVFLNISVILYGSGLDRFKKVMGTWDQKKRMNNILNYFKELRASAHTLGKESDQALTCMPKLLIGLMEQMLDFDPQKRPTAQQVSKALVNLGGIDQIYYGRCCKRGSTEVSQSIDENFKALQEANSRNEQHIRELSVQHEKDRSELQALLAIKETYRLRVEHEQTRVNEQYKTLLQKRETELANANQEVKRLEAELAALQNPRKPRRGRGHIPSHLIANHNTPHNAPRGPSGRPQFPPNRSNLPLPIRPSTPIRPAISPPKRPPLGQGSWSNNSTIVGSFYSASSRGTLPESPASFTISSESANSTPPLSPTVSKAQLAPAKLTKEVTLGADLTAVSPHAPVNLPIPREKTIQPPTWAQVTRSATATKPLTLKDTTQIKRAPSVPRDRRAPQVT